MNNLREVKDDLLKEWIKYREETIFAIMNEEDQDRPAATHHYCYHLGDCHWHYFSGSAGANIRYVQRNFQ